MGLQMFLFIFATIIHIIVHIMSIFMTHSAAFRPIFTAFCFFGHFSAFSAFWQKNTPSAVAIIG